ncbi:MAG: metalloregulator ArsR/SmtB family transcription factor [Trueperaceae bacterium]|nr:metalloregulator ArsR/SmtB family transcription factor [Trueperaceae bacterium]
MPEPLKRRIYERLAHVPKALASARRLELVDLLAQAEKSVETLARESGQSVANASQHLQQLRRAGLVEVRRDRTYGYYRLAGDDVLRLWQAVRALGEARLADMDRLLDELHPGGGEPAPLTMDELRDHLARGGTVLLDVRPSDEYHAGHIPGALSVPVDELPERIHELPDDAEVVAYCRGPYCVFSDEAVALLRAHGIPAARLQEGFPDWRAAGLPTEGSPA